MVLKFLLIQELNPCLWLAEASPSNTIKKTKWQGFIVSEKNSSIGSNDGEYGGMKIWIN